MRAGRHDRAARHFCLRFAERCFPLEYAWTGGRNGQLLVELASGIQHEAYGETWEEIGDLWSLRPAFLLSWALMEDPYGPLRDEFLEDEFPDEARATEQPRLCDEARDAVAQFAQLDVQHLFAGVPPDGFSADYLCLRFYGTLWEPLLWAAPWLWRLSGNPFLDRADEDYPEPEPWSPSSVLRLSAAYREALRVMRAIDALDAWLVRDPSERTRAALEAALGPPTGRLSTLADLPLAECRAAVRGACAMPTS